MLRRPPQVGKPLQRRNHGWHPRDKARRVRYYRLRGGRQFAAGFSKPGVNSNTSTGQTMSSLSQPALDMTAAELQKAGTEPISRDAACRLLRADDDLLPHLLSAAQAARARFKPGFITYSRKVFLPLTNLCRDYCGYCTFRRDPGQPGAHTMMPDEIMEVVRAGERMGCTEALFSLGDKPELVFPEMRDTLQRLGFKSTLHYLEAMCEKVLRESSLLPHPNPGLMSAEWLHRLARVAPSMGLMLETTSARLLAKDAAHDNAPDKDPSKRLRVIEDAGRQKIPFTTGILIGIGETMEERVDALIAIRDLHDAVRPHSGSDRAKFPRQTWHADGRMART